MKPIKNKEHLDRICEAGDILDGTPAEPHHPVSFGRGVSQKASDILAIPLSREHHSELHRSMQIVTTKGVFNESDLLALTIQRELYGY